jgi:hypothetical protein
LRQADHAYQQQAYPEYPEQPFQIGLMPREPTA